ncbi:MAG: hypothetical protein EOM14_00165 [Clostridia bacterium]|nr:hypothetical protein [Clostridia bacterium]
MDRVKADEELKEKTAAYVRAALNKTESSGKISNSELAFKKEKHAVKRLIIAASSVAACIIFALGANAYYHAPVNYVCVDINPSVELGINAFGRVVCSQAYNEDGLRLIEESNLSNMSVENAVRSLVQKAAAQGFILEDGSTVIAVTSESVSEKKAAELQSISEAGANSALSEGGISAVIYSDCSDLQLRKQALEAEISPGKLRLILLLQALDSNIAVEDYRNAKITDIITKINELLSQAGDNWQNGDYAEMCEKIINAAQCVQAAEQEQNRNGGQNQDFSEQEKNQDQQTSGNAARNQTQTSGAQYGNGGTTQNNYDSSNNGSVSSGQETAAGNDTSHTEGRQKSSLSGG